jgi:hypothetical protein
MAAAYRNRRAAAIASRNCARKLGSHTTVKARALNCAHDKLQSRVGSKWLFRNGARASNDVPDWQSTPRA